MTALTGFFNYKSHSGITKPGASVFLVPWAGTKANTNWNTRTQVSTVLSGGRLDSSGAQNAEYTTDIWLDDGTYKYAQEYLKAPDAGIHSVQLDAVEQGTIDAYNASLTLNNYTEITGIVITKGLKVFKNKMATKNGASTNYFGYVLTSAWIRTGA